MNFLTQSDSLWALDSTSDSSARMRNAKQMKVQADTLSNTSSDEHKNFTDGTASGNEDSIFTTHEDEERARQEGD